MKKYFKKTLLLLGAIAMAVVPMIPKKQLKANIYEPILYEVVLDGNIQAMNLGNTWYTLYVYDTILELGYNSSNNTYYIYNLEVRFNFVNNTTGVQTPKSIDYPINNISFSLNDNIKYIGVEFIKLSSGDYMISVDFYINKYDEFSSSGNGYILDEEPQILPLDMYYNDERIRYGTPREVFRYDEVEGAQYQLGYTEGQQVGIQQGYKNGFEDGENHGYKNGYNIGLNEGINTQDMGLLNLLTIVFSSFGTFLSFEILPNITLGGIVTIPLVLGIIFFIIGKKGE